MTNNVPDLQYGRTRINLVRASDLESLEAVLKAHNSVVLRLDGSNVCDEASFLREAAQQLPCPYGYQTYRGFDGFTDSFYEGIAILEVPLAALIWTDCERMLVHGLQGLIVACDSLLHVGDLLIGGDRPGVPGSTTMFLTFLAGEGDSFPPFNPNGLLLH
jgi:hypothetical protein